MSETLSPSASCEYFPTCNACQLWDLGYSAQKDLKVARLKDLLNLHGLESPASVEFVSSGEFGLRDRIDFTFKFDPVTAKFHFGFYDKDKILIPVKKCLQMSSQLQKIFEEFSLVEPKTSSANILKGSVRLRTGVGGLKGCWLDFSNLDIKHLLEDGTYLRTLLSKGFKVEMGQKGKSVTEVNGQLKLTDPKAHQWFKTVSANGSEIPLSCLVSDFTQPSVQSAKALTTIVLNWALKIKTGNLSVIEFGPGIGQFTLPLLSAKIPVTALEVDAAACENLRLNASFAGDELLTIKNDDFQRRDFSDESGLILVNPARSGLKKFTDSISQSKAEFLIYVSCFPESMCEDLERLKSIYRIQEIKIVDQFPQTNHFESCVFLQRIK
ncbi:MAG: methyltransferase [Pseudobdellovibrio sp.]|jgi:tRNA/tmRNA/rRNA uracil-C5-methylase (TrmA/RlmC/RlmD family)|nr:methyltransferase [Pseudobdellovibrio sp.]